MITYITKQGDMLDAICYKYYQRTDCLEDVLAYNRDLAQHGIILPSGISIQLPPLDKQTKKKKISLW